MEEVFYETEAEAMRQEINRALGTGRIKHHPADGAGADWLRRANSSADAFNPRRQLRSDVADPGPRWSRGPICRQHYVRIMSAGLDRFTDSADPESWTRNSRCLCLWYGWMAYCCKVR